MCQSHTGRLTGLWFLPKPAFGLNTNDDDDDDDDDDRLFNDVFNSADRTECSKKSYTSFTHGGMADLSVHQCLALRPFVYKHFLALTPPLTIYTTP